MTDIRLSNDETNTLTRLINEKIIELINKNEKTSNDEYKLLILNNILRKIG